MGLAGRQKKQKISDDPRNTKWVNDTSLPGHTLLSRMGWSGTSDSLAHSPHNSSSKPFRRRPTVPTPKDDNLGLGARPGQSLTSGGLWDTSGRVRLAGLVEGMGWVRARHGRMGRTFDGDGELEDDGVKKSGGGGDFGRLLERLNRKRKEMDKGKDENNSPVVSKEYGEEKAAEGQDNDGEPPKKKRKKTKEEKDSKSKRFKKDKKRDDVYASVERPTTKEIDDTNTQPSSESLPASAQLDQVSTTPKGEVVATMTTTSNSTTTTTTTTRRVVINPRLASRARNLASKRAAASNLDAMREILGITGGTVSSVAADPAIEAPKPAVLSPSPAPTPESKEVIREDDGENEGDSDQNEKEGKKTKGDKEKKEKRKEKKRKRDKEDEGTVSEKGEPNDSSPNVSSSPMDSEGQTVEKETRINEGREGDKKKKGKREKGEKGETEGEEKKRKRKDRKTQGHT